MLENSGQRKGEMKSERRLTVEFGDDSRVDEYRIHGREVEFRSRGVNGEPLPDVSGEWKQLTADDISLHLALDTVVGEWLTWRLLKTAPPVYFHP